MDTETTTFAETERTCDIANVFSYCLVSTIEYSIPPLIVQSTRHQFPAKWITEKPRFSKADGNGRKQDYKAGVVARDSAVNGEGYGWYARWIAYPAIEPTAHFDLMRASDKNESSFASHAWYTSRDFGFPRRRRFPSRYRVSSGK
ncbi:hypothetical protein KM043_011659 [Ampulex compressa]|nr:hypothetical protein KM043_011659 [Ampulex compressa]